MLVGCVSDMIAEEPEKISGWYEMTFCSIQALLLSFSIYLHFFFFFKQLLVRQLFRYLQLLIWRKFWVSL